MAKKLEMNNNLNDNSELFIQKIKSEMVYQSDYSSSALDFAWLDEVEFACPYLDNIVINPKVSLVREEEIVKIDKAKKISVTSIKDLSRHTHYIDKVDAITQEVQPSKLLIETSEETYNTYENRFLFTLIQNLARFVMIKEKEIDEIKIKDGRVLEYSATTIANNERINIELKITANEIPNNSNDDSKSSSVEDKINDVKERIVLLNRFIYGWQKSILYTTLTKQNVAKTTSPIKRTNLILKNPNFQVAAKLWDYMQSYEDAKESNNTDGHSSTGNDILVSILDDAFLMDYFVLDSITISKREQKKRISDYAIVMMHQQIKRVIAMLLNNGITISDQEILDIIADELKKEKNKSEINSTEVKTKFKDAIDEYLEKTKNYL